MALISVNDLHFSYDDAGPEILTGINLDIEAGERIAILGGNGSGKSTLSQFISGWFPRGIHKASQGTVLTNGAEWDSLSVQERTERVQFVGQVPMQQMSGFSFTVWDEIVFGPGNLNLPAEVIRARAEKAVEMCNLDHLRDRDPFSLSGGEQQRLSIAAAVVMQPKALVLDEPTGNFDPESRDAFLAQIANLPEDLAIVWCDVALGPPLCVANRFVVLDSGKIVFDGSAADLMTHPSTNSIFGLPAIAEAASLLRSEGLWPQDQPLPLTVQSAAETLRSQMEAPL